MKRKFELTEQSVKVAAAMLLVVAVQACAPSMQRRYVSDGGTTSTAGSWSGGASARPPSFGRSPDPPRLPPQVATVPGMPAAGVAPYRPRIPAFFSGMLVLTLLCIAPDAPVNAAPAVKPTISTRKNSPSGEVTITPRTIFECNTPSR